MFMLSQMRTNRRRNAQFVPTYCMNFIVSRVSSDGRGAPLRGAFQTKLCNQPLKSFVSALYIRSGRIAKIMI